MFDSFIDLIDSNGIHSENEIYYMGIIDILQEYSYEKRMERFWKVNILKRDMVCRTE
jgi:hypothetical protein